MLYDIYHMQIMEGDLIRTIQTHHAWFGHYHTAGNPGRHEPDDSQEINYPAIYRAIRATGYDGWIGMEFVPTCEPVAAMRAARVRLERVAQAGTLDCLGPSSAGNSRIGDQQTSAIRAYRGITMEAAIRCHHHLR